jgi:hypothetical protein
MVERGEVPGGMADVIHYEASGGCFGTMAQRQREKSGEVADFRAGQGTQS